MSNNLKKKCYEKGISLYTINAPTKQVVRKNVSVLSAQCENPKRTNVNEQSLMYGVPPRPERVLAYMNQMGFNNAYKETGNIFFSPRKPMQYHLVTPIPYQPLTWPVNHEVYTIDPIHFPGPSANRVSRARTERVKNMVARKMPEKIEKQKEKKQRYYDIAEKRYYEYQVKERKRLQQRTKVHDPLIAHYQRMLDKKRKQMQKQKNTQMQKKNTQMHKQKKPTK